METLCSIKPEGITMDLFVKRLTSNSLLMCQCGEPMPPQIKKYRDAVFYERVCIEQKK